MSISFNRNRVQVLYESIIGISTPEELKEKRADFQSHVLTAPEAAQLSNALDQDAIDFFYNGVISFSEGIDAVFQKRFSWATVELYYSIYYLLRASMAARGYAILRCRNMHRLLVKSGEKTVSSGSKKYNTTHEGTISHYRDLFSASDMLLSNKIEDYDAYEWMMNAREIVNYRSSAFLEPDCLDIWDYYSQCADDGTLANALFQLESDPYVMCFQEEYAVVAIPIKCMQQTIAHMGSRGLLSSIEERRNECASSIIKYDNRSLAILKQAFGK